MEDLQHSCAFTGHRPYKLPWKDNEKDPRFIAFQDRLKGQITALVDSGITDFYTGMAEGTDLWACQRRCDFVVFRRTWNVEKWRVNVYSY